MASSGEFGSRSAATLEGEPKGASLSGRETEHLRVLIANERKDRLTLVAPGAVVGLELIRHSVQYVAGGRTKQRPALRRASCSQKQPNSELAR